MLNARGHRGGGQSKINHPGAVRGQCSTPGGIEAEGRGTARWRTSPASSAQRPGASRRRAARACSRPGTRSGVLNARGHRGGGQRPLTPRTECHRRCSTPGGIEAEGSVPGLGAVPRQDGAQRPGASRRRAVHVGAVPHVEGDVLNARGHRGGGQDGRASVRFGRGAVLNARGHRGGGQPAPPSITSGGGCAQRPGASRRRAGFRPSCARASFTVCSTPGGIEAEGSRSREGCRLHQGVLNARGHRGGGQSGSTSGSRPRTRVLNARGHRGGGQGSVRMKAVVVVVCSTPGGIEAEGSSRCAGGGCGGGRAQRPGASRRRAEPGRPPRRGLDRVLNARGHRGGGQRSGTWTRRWSSSGAQRPGASRRRAAGRRRDNPHVRRVLNARGHRGGGQQRRLRWSATPPGCAQRPGASRRRAEN